MASDVITEQVMFRSGESHCAGDLYLPANLGEDERRPAIVLGHGFSSVKYALVTQGEFFARAGYVALAIDYRTFGASEGEPRGQVFPLWQVEDFRSAISYLETRPEVESDAIGIWGTSVGGGVALYVGAVDRRARVVISEKPVTDGRRWSRAIRTTEQWEDLLDRLDEDRRRRFAGYPSERVPVTSHGAVGEFAAMPADPTIVEFLMSMAAQNWPGWQPEVTLESVEKIIEFDPSSVIHRIGPRPLLIVALRGWDMIHPIEHILEAYNRASEPKQIELLDYDQFGLHVEPGATEAMRRTLPFLEKHLPLHGTTGRAIPRTAFSIEPAAAV